MINDAALVDALRSLSNEMLRADTAILELMEKMLKRVEMLENHVAQLESRLILLTIVTHKDIQ
jgi:hypothetical protein